MASLLDMQRLLGGTPIDMYQPPVPSVDEETQKLIDQVIDKEKRKPQALLNLFNLLSSGNQTAEQIIKFIGSSNGSDYCWSNFTKRNWHRRYIRNCCTTSGNIFRNTLRSFINGNRFIGKYATDVWITNT